MFSFTRLPLSTPTTDTNHKPRFLPVLLNNCYKLKVPMTPYSDFRHPSKLRLLHVFPTNWLKIRGSHNLLFRHDQFTRVAQKTQRNILLTRCNFIAQEWPDGREAESEDRERHRVSMPSPGTSLSPNFQGFTNLEAL